MIKYIFFVVLFFIGENVLAQKNIILKFENIANEKKIILDETIFTNANKESYTISKLRYYISNIHFVNESNYYPKNVFLVDASKKDSIKIMKPKNYIGISFEIGVDSVLNCSGAQNGALDPLNDMFWTWNSGYVNFKLEGKLVDSTTKIEHHIGGYKTPYITKRRIFIALPKDYLKNKAAITIQMDLDKYWSSTNIIASNPVITSPGELAAKAADNFTKMFSLKNEN